MEGGLGGKVKAKVGKACVQGQAGSAHRSLSPERRCPWWGLPSTGVRAQHERQVAWARGGDGGQLHLQGLIQHVHILRMGARVSLSEKGVTKKRGER